MGEILADHGSLGTLTPGSVTRDLAALRSAAPHAGNDVASIHQSAIVRRTRGMMRGISPRFADAEDIAQEAIVACITSIRRGGSGWVQDRQQLWRLLLAAAKNKVRDCRKKLSRKKHGGDAIRGESAFIPLEGASEAYGISQVRARVPTPDRAVMMTEEWRLFLASLKPEVRDVVLLRADGCTQREIAQRLGVAVVTVERRLKLVRMQWDQRNL